MFRCVYLQYTVYLYPKLPTFLASLCSFSSSQESFLSTPFFFAGPTEQSRTKTEDRTRSEQTFFLLSFHLSARTVLLDRSRPFSFFSWSNPSIDSARIMTGEDERGRLFQLFSRQARRWQVSLSSRLSSDHHRRPIFRPRSLSVPYSASGQKMVPR